MELHAFQAVDVGATPTSRSLNLDVKELVYLHNFVSGEVAKEEAAIGYYGDKENGTKYKKYKDAKKRHAFADALAKKLYEQLFIAAK